MMKKLSLLLALLVSLPAFGGYEYGTSGQFLVVPASGRAQYRLIQASDIPSTLNGTTFSTLTDSGLSTAGIVTNTSGGLLGTVTTVPEANGGWGQSVASSTGVPSFSSGAITFNSTLPASLGGTGVASPTLGSLYIGNGSSAMTAVAPSTARNVLMSTGSTWAARPYIPPSVQTMTSGSGTYFPTWAFVVSSANATSGATYTNNGVTFTVSQTIASGTILYTTDAVTTAPSSSGTLTKVTGTGDATITFSQAFQPLYLRVRAIGGGGGGGTGGTGASTAATGGGTTTWASTVLSAGGGGLGSSITSGAGGSGGTASSAAPAVVIASITGQPGQGAPAEAAASQESGGAGGGNCIAGGGAGAVNGAGGAGIANTGGGGAGGSGSANVGAGGGGGGGACIEAIIPTVSSSTTWAVGAAGTGGSGGSGGAGGGNAAAGRLDVLEFFQ